MEDSSSDLNLKLLLIQEKGSIAFKGVIMPQQPQKLRMIHSAKVSSIPLGTEETFKLTKASK